MNEMQTKQTEHNTVNDWTEGLPTMTPHDLEVLGHIKGKRNPSDDYMTIKDAIEKGGEVYGEVPLYSFRMIEDQGLAINSLISVLKDKKRSYPTVNVLVSGGEVTAFVPDVHRFATPINPWQDENKFHKIDEVVVIKEKEADPGFPFNPELFDRDEAALVRAADLRNRKDGVYVAAGATADYIFREDMSDHVKEGLVAIEKRRIGEIVRNNGQVQHVFHDELVGHTINSKDGSEETFVVQGVIVKPSQSKR